MRKIVLLIAVVIFGMTIMYGDNLVSVCDNWDTEMYCTYLDSSGIECGDYYISSNDISRHIAFGESVVVSHFDIYSFIQELSASVIRIDYIDDMPVYLLYTADLGRYKTIGGEKYNLQIAVNDSYAKIGYPAIFDSF